ncbi:MAG: IS110 family transposase [Alphaproteobacteria bacterium]|nr:IS110 family transposase [Alphaproteobacteria bacterium]
MGDVTTIGLDIAKTSFQAHGADASGAVVFRKKLSRGRLLAFFAGLPACVVVMETCSGAHHWGREFTRMGHTVRLIPPAYVKPFVKRQKNDEADAEAICEAAQRPTMRFVAVKSAEQQALGVVFRARDLLVRQRTQISNAIRGHVAEFGTVAPKGVCYVDRLVAMIEDADSALPAAARESLKILVAVLAKLSEEVAVLDREIARRVKGDLTARRLMTIPGVGPVTAAAMVALAPGPQAFRRGRDFSAWLGLTPLQKSTGGKQKLGQITKMGERTLRRLLVIGASAVIKQALLKGAPPGSWLAQIIARKPRMLAAVALANKTARVVWALLANGGTYRAPALAA